MTSELIAGLDRKRRSDRLSPGGRLFIFRFRRESVGQRAEMLVSERQVEFIGPECVDSGSRAERHYSVRRFDGKRVSAGL